LELLGFFIPSAFGRYIRYNTSKVFLPFRNRLALLLVLEDKMKAYRTYLTVTDDKKIVLSDLPFQPGQKVEVLVLAQDEGRIQVIQRLDVLLKTTQTLPQVQAITDDEIAAEIAACRSDQ
jgi:hypothetical protein